MELIKTQIQVSMNKTELNSLISKALENPDTAIAIKKVLSPLLADAFPQFPDFSVISIGETTEDGSTLVILKQPTKTPKKTGPIKSIEPAVIDTPDDKYQEDSEENTPSMSSTTPYIDPEA